MEPESAGRHACPFLVDRLAHQPDFRRDVEAATRLGISHRRWSGWEPKEVTEHVYEDGRLVRSATTREAEWDGEQRGLVLALLSFEGQSCHGCGGFLPETTDPDNDGRYKAGYPGRCYRCSAIKAQQKAYEDQKPESLVLWPVELKRKGGSGG